MSYLNPIATLVLVLFSGIHDGPDPIGSWRLSKSQLRGQVLIARLGQHGQVKGPVRFMGKGASEALYFDGKSTEIILASNFAESKQKLPSKHITIDACVAINSPTRWGSILGLAQDNGDSEKGWILGYNERFFTFGLASKGGDDGDGKITFVASKTPYEEGRFYYLTGTYDGTIQRLYVNGKLEAESRIQSGAILYPKKAPLMLGGYRDANEFNPFHGRIHTARLFNQCASKRGVQHAYQALASLTKSEPQLILDPSHSWVVKPYLQWATMNSMTIMWETSRPSSTVVHVDDHVTFSTTDGKKVPVFDRSATSKGLDRMHELKLTDLKPDTAYYYQVESVDDQERVLRSPILSFQTAPNTDSPFAFVVISDTQGNPKVSGKIAKMAWALRPNFVLHPGDLVETGPVKKQWVEHFFGSMQPLLGRVALFPALGNHEQDTRFFYDYMSLPKPEYYYTFRYGNAQFFVLDSNRKIGPGSEQYKFLNRELAKSKAQWKIVCHHHPPYTSDENDYGDTWHGPSTRGDMRAKQLVPLFDKYGVDIVWNGHIHSYERTWPLRAGKATNHDSGTLYMVTGGAGGPLELAGPIRPHFQNTVKHGHHFCYVAINNKTLELKSFDLDGRLFDTLRIEKK